MEVEVGQHQTVSYYEVAAGTDRRYPGTRTNIHHYVNVGLNKTWTFNNLNLIPRTATYFMTVRAHGVSTSVVERSSNGVKTGYNSYTIQRGTVNVRK